MPDINYYHAFPPPPPHLFLGTCTLPSVTDMMNDIDKKRGEKLKW